jgi:hypothetical protein
MTSPLEKARRARKSVTRAARTYHISKNEVRELRARPCCEICKCPFGPELYPCIDHNHATGKVRGALCHTCNYSVVGFIEQLCNVKPYLAHLVDAAVCYLCKHGSSLNDVLLIWLARPKSEPIPWSPPKAPWHVPLAADDYDAGDSRLGAM